MPILQVKLGCKPSAEISTRVAAALTDLTVEILKKKREVTAVAIEYISPSEWFVAGATAASHGMASFYLDIKVTAGTNTKDEKALYVTRAFSAVADIIGPLAPASYVVIDDVPADCWGYQGQTQEWRYVRGKPL